MNVIDDYQFLSRLRSIASPIAKRWGVWYPLKIIQEKEIVGGYTDLREVFVHKHGQLLSDAQLHSILAHEWMHCMEMPRTRARQCYFMETVAARLGRREMWIGPALALAMELLVDHFNCQVEEWGDEYSVTTWKLLELGWRERGEKASALAGLIIATRLLVLKKELPTKLERYRKIAQTGIDALLGKDLIKVSCPRKISDDTYLERMTDFCVAIGSRLDGADALSIETGMELLIERVSSGLPGIETRTIGKRQGSLVQSLSSKKHTNREDFDPKIVHKVGDVLRWHRNSEPRIGIWYEGHPLTQLDMKRSYRIAPVLVPGLSTRRRMAGERVAIASGAECDTRVLVVDDSGSMDGEPARLARSLAEGLNRMSASVQLEIGLLVFASEVVYQIEPGYRYDEIRAVLKTLHGDSGGTSLLPAIQALMEMHRRRPLTHLVIISDAKTDDWTQALQPLLKELTLRMSIILINERIPAELRVAVKRRYADRIRLVQVDPGTVAEKEWIKEIAW